MTDEAGLVQVDDLTRELAEANTIPDVKKVRDKAEALRTLAKKIGASLELQNRYAIAKIDAEAKAGFLLEHDPEVNRGRRSN